MQQTDIRRGIYINPETALVLRVDQPEDLQRRQGHWELLSENPDLGLLACRDMAFEKGYTDDKKAVDWHRMHEEEAEPAEDLEVLEEINKAQAKAEAEAQAEKERLSTPMVT